MWFLITFFYVLAGLVMNHVGYGVNTWEWWLVIFCLFMVDILSHIKAKAGE